MSWILGKAEDLLNRVDQVAGQALQKEKDAANAAAAATSLETVSEVTVTHSSETRSSTVQASVLRTQQQNVTNYTQVTSTTTNTVSNAGLATSSRVAPPPGLPSTGSRASLKRDKDEELFEFLNASDNGTGGDTNGSHKRGASVQSGKTSLSSGRHSRQSSASSSVSANGKTTDSGFSFIAMPETEDTAMKMERTTDSSPSHSDGSREFTPAIAATEHKESSVELENKLLKHEIQSLNQEMSSVIGRAKAAQDELIRVKKQLETSQAQLSRGDAIMREIQGREADLQEALTAKDSQIGVLRIRFEELEKDLQDRNRVMEELRTTRDRILEDQSSASGMQSQAFESLQEKLKEAEEQLRKEKNDLQQYQQDSQNRQSKVESELQSLSSALTTAQKKVNEEKGRTSEMQGQLKAAKSQAENGRQELVDYKEKAQRILQSKERLILTLKEGGAAGADGSAGAAVTGAELDAARQEIGVMREELQHNRMTIENLRAECQDLETQMQQESESLNENISALEEQLQLEKRSREDAEQELARNKQELRYAHEELHKQKSAFQTRLQERESEIEKLRSQLMTKSFSNSGQTELENRLHSLTESLIQKQTNLEALNTEKNALTLQLERSQKQYRELELTASAAPRATSVHIHHEDDEVRNRLPGFLRESPTDGEVTRRVKSVYGTVDRFSVRIGVFLRRYPIARVFVIGYMLLLHFWTMIVLLTYKPEIHGEDYNPHPPGPMH